MENLRLIHDAGHGWLEVPTQAVIASGIVPSKYSYVDADAGMTYLEEDCDLGKYLAVIGDEPPMTNVYIAGDAWVRDLPRWITWGTKGILIDGLSATDLREEAPAYVDAQAFQITVYNSKGEPHPEVAQALWSEQIGRLGIAWGADADWADTESVETGIAMWLNDPTEWGRRA